MDWVTEKVMQRLTYEKLLLKTGLASKRKRIILAEVLHAGKFEPKIFMVLPAIVLFKPQIIFQLWQDLKAQPVLKNFCENLFTETKPKMIFGVRREDCCAAAEKYRGFLKVKMAKRKSYLRTFRFSENEIERLIKLTKFMGTSGNTETLRKLIQEKSFELQL